MPDEFNLLESVINITKKRDRKSLSRILVESLTKFVKSSNIELIKITREEGEIHLEIAESVLDNNLNREVKLDETTAQCIDNHEVLSEKTDGSKRTLFPVSINGKTSEIVVIYSEEIPQESENTILGFVHIYSNFIDLLEESEKDTLTGLLNRKTFDQQLSELFLAEDSLAQESADLANDRREKSQAENHWFGVLDIDHFKKINDNFGHIYGDEVLLLFANLMRKTFRRNDILFRHGGEEFVVVLSPTSEKNAFGVFERFRTNLEQLDIPQVGQITVSIGMVKIDNSEHSSTVLEKSDRALYYAKDNGRNRVCSYQTLVKSGAFTVEQHTGEIELF